METKAKYKHEEEDLLDALNIDREKVHYITNTLLQMEEKKPTSATSETLANMIQKCTTPEELAWLAYQFGKSSCGQCPLKKLGSSGIIIGPFGPNDF